MVSIAYLKRTWLMVDTKWLPCASQVNNEGCFIMEQPRNRSYSKASCSFDYMNEVSVLNFKKNFFFIWNACSMHLFTLQYVVIVILLQERGIQTLLISWKVESSFFFFISVVFVSPHILTEENMKFFVKNFISNHKILDFWSFWN